MRVRRKKRNNKSNSSHSLFKSGAQTPKANGANKSRNNSYSRNSNSAGSTGAGTATATGSGGAPRTPKSSANTMRVPRSLSARNRSRSPSSPMSAFCVTPSSDVHRLSRSPSPSFTIGVSLSYSHYCVAFPQRRPSGYAQGFHLCLAFMLATRDHRSSR